MLRDSVNHHVGRMRVSKPAYKLSIDGSQVYLIFGAETVAHGGNSLDIKFWSFERDFAPVRISGSN